MAAYSNGVYNVYTKFKAVKLISSIGKFAKEIVYN